MPCHSCTSSVAVVGLPTAAPTGTEVVERTGPARPRTRLAARSDPAGPELPWPVRPVSAVRALGPLGPGPRTLRTRRTKRTRAAGPCGPADRTARAVRAVRPGWATWTLRPGRAVRSVGARGTLGTARALRSGTARHVPTLYVSNDVDDADVVVDVDCASRAELDGDQVRDRSAWHPVDVRCGRLCLRRRARV